jgi:TonB family protein
VSWFYFSREADRPVVRQNTSVQQDIPEMPLKITPIDSGADKSVSEEKISEKPVTEDIPLDEVPANTPEKLDLQRKPEPEIKEDGYFQAEPLMGYSDLYEYFNANLVYPVEALKDSIQGVQTVSFVINTKGKPEQIEVIKSLGQPFEKECLRLIENMPEWKPATLNGKPVNSKISIPLTFQIQKLKNN